MHAMHPACVCLCVSSGTQSMASDHVAMGKGEMVHVLEEKMRLFVLSLTSDQNTRHRHDPTCRN